MADINKYFSQDQKRRCLMFLKTLTFAAGDTEKSFTIETSCLLHYIILTLPNWTNAVTASIILEQDLQTNRELWIKSSIAENQQIKIAPDIDGVNWPIPMDGEVLVRIVLSGVPGGTGGDVEVLMFGV